MDVERSSGREHLVGGREHGRESLGLGEPAVRHRVQVREVDHGPHPAAARRDRDHVLERADLAHAAHDLDAERNSAALLLQPLA